MKILVLDNYDSFTWNLVHGLEAAGGRCTVYRSDGITLDAVEDFKPERIVLSPGPFGPQETGICGKVVRRFAGRVPILGVCLGMQVIAHAMGGSVEASGRPVHGKASRVWHDGEGVLRGLPNPFEAARYHSLIVAPSSLPKDLAVSAWAEDRTIMACRLPDQRVEGVLFHPESFLTPEGPRMFANFLER